MTNQHITPLFFMPLYRANVSLETLEDTRSLVYNFINSEEWKTMDHGDRLQTETTYHEDTKKNFLGNIKADKMLDELYPHCKDYLELLDIDSSKDLNLESWLNLNTPDTWHDPHEHYGALVSGTVYIEVPEDSGDIIFYDPVKTRTQFNVINGDYRKNKKNYFDEFRVSPIAGEFLLFEPWITHSVAPNLTDQTRISISFNIGTDRG